jgi:DNA-binding HxlR family transcriptional regulator
VPTRRFYIRFFFYNTVVLRRRLGEESSGRITRSLKRLRVHGLIKKVGRTYKYYLTALGKQVIALGLKLKELYIIPVLSLPATR